MFQILKSNWSLISFEMLVKVCLAVKKGLLIYFFQKTKNVMCHKSGTQKIHYTQVVEPLLSKLL